MSVAFQKFNCLVQDMGRGVHNLNTDDFYVLLTNTVPTASMAVIGDVTGSLGSSGRGDYVAGGASTTTRSYSQTSGVGTMAAGNVVFTATGAIGPFQYAVLYNNTASGKNLVGWWNYGSSISLANTDTFTVNLSANVLTVTKGSATGNWNPFDCWVGDIGLKKHNLNSDALLVYLTNTAPTAGNTVYNTPADLSTAGGYTAGGAAASGNTFTQTSGTATLTGGNVVTTATGAVGPFRYAVLYNNTAASKNLINWWDYGSSISLANTDTFTVNLASNILTLT